MLPRHSELIFFFFFNDTATTEIYTLSLHDALPISPFHPWRISKVCYSPFDFISLALTPTGSRVSYVPPSMHLCSTNFCSKYGMGYVLTDRSVDLHFTVMTEIGRASCRERVKISVVAVSLKKKKLLAVQCGGTMQNDI